MEKPDAAGVEVDSFAALVGGIEMACEPLLPGSK
jgi:hypothetical protein